MIARLAVALVALGLFGAGTQPQAAESESYRIYSIAGTFEDVKQDVVLAIENRGLVVERPLHIGEMLDRTGKDVGNGKAIYRQAEALQFCSALLSRRMMQADPANIVFCPYLIVIYTLAGDSKKVYVGYRRPAPTGTPASQAALREIDALLDGIAREAAGMKPSNATPPQK